MESRRLNDWMQIFALVGVIVSLIFVGLEIRQSREIAIADIYQQRTALLLQDLTFANPSEAIAESVRKEREGESA